MPQPRTTSATNAEGIRAPVIARDGLGTCDTGPYRQRRLTLDPPIVARCGVGRLRPLCWSQLRPSCDVSRRRDRRPVSFMVAARFSLGFVVV